MTPGGNQNRRVAWQDVTPMRPVQKTRKRKFSIQQLKRLNSFKLSRKRLIILLIIIVVAALAFLTVRHFFPTTTVKPTTNGSQSSSAGSLVPGNPQYPIILPAGKTIKDLGGGWVRSDSQPLFIYVDKIGSVQINVSEQPLPDNFKDNPAGHVGQLAQAYGATEKITLSEGTIYIGSFDSGLQRVIFTKSNLLVLITSNSHLTDNDWATYINSLN